MALRHPDLGLSPLTHPDLGLSPLRPALNPGTREKAGETPQTAEPETLKKRASDFRMWRSCIFAYDGWTNVVSDESSQNKRLVPCKKKNSHDQISVTTLI